MPWRDRYEHVNTHIWCLGALQCEIQHSFALFRSRWPRWPLTPVLSGWFWPVVSVCHCSWRSCGVVWLTWRASPAPQLESPSWKTRSRIWKIVFALKKGEELNLQITFCPHVYTLYKDKTKTNPCWVEMMEVLIINPLVRVCLVLCVKREKNSVLASQRRLERKLKDLNMAMEEERETLNEQRDQVSHSPSAAGQALRLYPIQEIALSCSLLFEWKLWRDRWTRERRSWKGLRPWGERPRETWKNRWSWRKPYRPESQHWKLSSSKPFLFMPRITDSSSFIAVYNFHHRRSQNEQLRLNLRLVCNMGEFLYYTIEYVGDFSAKTPVMS